MKALHILFLLTLTLPAHVGFMDRKFRKAATEILLPITGNTSGHAGYKENQYLGLAIDKNKKATLYTPDGKSTPFSLKETDMIIFFRDQRAKHTQLIIACHQDHPYSLVDRLLHQAKKHGITQIGFVSGESKKDKHNLSVHTIYQKPHKHDNPPQINPMIIEPHSSGSISVSYDNSSPETFAKTNEDDPLDILAEFLTLYRHAASGSTHTPQAIVSLESNVSIKQIISVTNLVVSNQITLKSVTLKRPLPKKIPRIAPKPLPPKKR